MRCLIVAALLGLGAVADVDVDVEDEAHPKHWAVHRHVKRGAASAVFDGGKKGHMRGSSRSDRALRVRHLREDKKQANTAHVVSAVAAPAAAAAAGVASASAAAAAPKAPGPVSAAAFPTPDSGLAWRASDMTKQMEPQPPKAPREFEAVPPSVADELGEYGELRNLRVTQHDANDAHGKFVDAANELSAHSTEGKSIKVKVAYKWEELRAKKQGLQDLEVEEAKLKETRDALRAKIEKVMGKKLNFAARRLKKTEADLNTTEAKFQELNATHEKVRAEALAKLQEKKDAKKAFKEANKELQAAQAAQQQAAKIFFNAKMDAGKEVQTYHMLVTQVKGAESALKAQRARTKRMKKSVKRLKSILDMEMAKVEKAFKFGEERLENRKRREEADINETATEMAEGNAAFAKWKEDQMARKEVKDEKKMQYDKQAQDYSHQRQDILEGAWKAAGAKAQHQYGSDQPDWAWNDWTWNGPDDAEAVLADASLDEKAEEGSSEEKAEKADKAEKAEGEEGTEEEGAEEGEGEGEEKEVEESAEAAEAEADAAEKEAAAPAEEG
eukprot:TRINITY_DN121184_c0_g1_i1.p2 TRINITY_DN121184_c0_g1~~TRINITY_DN121184_c0_g1_i1.p2  ORF type:complete len:557 (-),score=270.31 TRINITY_DN121184_c0_g1_i1:40-1710(-)